MATPTPDKKKEKDDQKALQLRDQLWSDMRDARRRIRRLNRRVFRLMENGKPLVITKNEDLALIGQVLSMLEGEMTMRAQGLVV